MLADCYNGVMKFEGAHNIEEGKIEKQKTLLELKNEMQFALALLHCHMDDRDCIVDWLSQNGESFQFAYDNVAARNGDMFKLWDEERDSIMDQLLGEIREIQGTAGEQRKAA